MEELLPEDAGGSELAARSVVRCSSEQHLVGMRRLPAHRSPRLLPHLRGFAHVIGLRCSTSTPKWLESCNPPATCAPIGAW